MPHFRPLRAIFTSARSIISKNSIINSVRNSSNSSTKTKPRARGLLGRPVLTTLLAAQFLTVGHLCVQYLYTIDYAAGPSMLPSFEVLEPGLLVSKRHRHGRGVAVGDIVVYDIPLNDEYGMKRVLGLPGDYVLIDTPGFGEGAMMQVPQGHCWLIGDNLPASRDSRTFGPVPLALVRGKVIAKTWPLSECHWIRNPFDGQGQGQNQSQSQSSPSRGSS